MGILVFLRENSLYIFYCFIVLSIYFWFWWYSTRLDRLKRKAYLVNRELHTCNNDDYYRIRLKLAILIDKIEELEG